VFRVFHIIPAKKRPFSHTALTRWCSQLRPEFALCGRNWNWNICCSELVLEWFEFLLVEVHFCDFVLFYFPPIFLMRVCVIYEKCPLASSCLSERFCACVSPASSRRLFVKLDMGGLFTNICLETRDLVESWQKYQELYSYIKTYVRL
jgi:hypothetical protein